MALQYALEYGHQDVDYEPTSRDPHERLANGLGWFSIGLGLAEILAPGKLAEPIGVNDGGATRAVLRTYGLREIGAGVGILSQPTPAAWVWSRVGGDILDLASLGAAMAYRDTDRGKLTAAIASVAGVTALDIYCAQQLSRKAEHTGASKRPFPVVRSVTLNRSREEVYRYWRDFENLPRFMQHLESVQVFDDRHSHWRAKAPAGASVEWDAEIIEDRPGQIIAWRSLEGADVYNSGFVRFDQATGGRGTTVRVELNYSPPGGAIGALFARLFGEEPSQQLDDDLRAFKQIMEVGEIVQSDASIHEGMHPAQPSGRSGGRQ